MLEYKGLAGHIAELKSLALPLLLIPVSEQPANPLGCSPVFLSGVSNEDS
jgi:hypothetical protein